MLRETRESRPIYFPFPIWPHAFVHVRSLLAEHHSIYTRQIRGKNATTRHLWTKIGLRWPREPLTSKLTFLSGFETSGKTEMNGRNTSRNFTMHQKERDGYFYIKTPWYWLDNDTIIIDKVSNTYHPFFIFFLGGQKLSTLMKWIIKLNCGQTMATAREERTRHATRRLFTSVKPRPLERLHKKIRSQGVQNIFFSRAGNKIIFNNKRKQRGKQSLTTIASH